MFSFFRELMNISISLHESEILMCLFIVELEGSCSPITEENFTEKSFAIMLFSEDNGTQSLRFQFQITLNAFGNRRLFLNCNFVFFYCIFILAE